MKEEPIRVIITEVLIPNVSGAKTGILGIRKETDFKRCGIPKKELNPPKILAKIEVILKR